MTAADPVIDVHQHVVRLDSLHLPVDRWAPPGVTGVPLDRLYRHGVADPAELVAYLDEEGVDIALLMSEYSPRVTGVQAIEHNLPLVDHAPDRIGLIAAINPHLHFPAVTELERQLDLGAVALKIHTVHGDFAPDRADLYPVYARCAEVGIPVVFHCGTSNFPGSANTRAEAASIAPVIRDFPDLDIVLAHGGRGWSYDAAAWFALTHPNVWIEVSGLPPSRLPRYYASVGFDRLAPRCIFGTDFPAIPGLRANADGIRALGLAPEVQAQVLWRNAARVYGFHRAPALAARIAALGSTAISD
ncbi:MAG TPA: amidohydrolase family protein [Euzebya sp.]|nr:amidohydrolase family protein [Euzebya sp.]